MQQMRYGVGKEKIIPNHLIPLGYAKEYADLFLLHLFPTQELFSLVRVCLVVGIATNSTS